MHLLASGVMGWGIGAMVGALSSPDLNNIMAGASMSPDLNNTMAWALLSPDLNIRMVEDPLLAFQIKPWICNLWA